MCATVEQHTHIGPLQQHESAPFPQRFTAERNTGVKQLNVGVPQRIADYIVRLACPLKCGQNHDRADAVLHSPAYRQLYNEFLKTDFPRVPYPTDKNQFRKSVTLGGELRTLHLLESPSPNTLTTSHPQTDDNTVTKPEYRITNVINRLAKSTSTKLHTSPTSPKPPGTSKSAATSPPKNG